MPRDGNEMRFLTNDGEPFALHPRTTATHIPVGRLPGAGERKGRWKVSHSHRVALQDPEDSPAAHGTLLAAFTATHQTRGNSDDMETAEAWKRPSESEEAAHAPLAPKVPEGPSKQERDACSHAMSRWARILRQWSVEKDQHARAGGISRAQ
eukprot:8975119-Pyramimonas_sp.AAC.1